MAILGYLTAVGNRYAGTVEALKAETQLPNVGDSVPVVSKQVLEKAWEKFKRQNRAAGLEAAIMGYLAAGGGRFARTVAAFEAEGRLSGGGSDAELEQAWAFVAKDLQSNSATTAFFNATKSNTLATVQLYTCVGIDVEKLKSRNKEYRNLFPLHWAAIHNRVDMVKHFLRIGHDKENGATSYVEAEGREWIDQSVTPLFIAAEYGHAAVVQYLIEQGAKKDAARDIGGIFPVQIAAQKGHLAVVQCLVELGVDKDIVDREGRTLIYIAADRGHLAVVKYLVEQGADKNKASHKGTITPLVVACSSGHADVAEYLLDQGCDCNHVCNKGYTALHLAAAGGHMDVAHLLFRWGANLDAQNSDGETPADVAIRRGHPEVADAIRAEEIRRRDHGFKRAVQGADGQHASKRPRVDAQQEQKAEENDDDDDDDDDDEDDEA